MQRKKERKMHAISPLVNSHRAACNMSTVTNYSYVNSYIV